MIKSTFVLSFCSFLLFTSATDISDLVFGKLDDAIPAAYGDFNSDELTDVFVLRDNFHTVEILLGSDVDHLLQSSTLKCKYSQRITSVVPGEFEFNSLDHLKYDPLITGDFDGDAFMDMMVTVDLGGDKIGVFINWGGSNHLNCSEPNAEPYVTMKGEPLALDYNYDMIIDLFGMDLEGQRTFWIFENTRNIPTNITMTHPEKKLSKLTIPHAHAVLDLDDDFAADLFLTTEDDNVEIWLATDKDKTHRFEYNRTIKFRPPGSDNKHYGQSIFLDLELNGSLNQLIPVCHDWKCMNSTLWVQSGEHYHDLGINFFQDDNNTQWGFLPPGKEFYSKTITLRTGDFNNDGFPDLLATLQKHDGATIQTFLMENVKDVNAKPADRFKRTFAVRWNALQPFGEGTVMGSFYDFYQDGILDVILLQKNGDTFKPLAFRNTLDYDANFVKVIVLTGLTNSLPPAKETAFGSKKRNYGEFFPF